MTVIRHRLLRVDLQQQPTIDARFHRLLRTARSGLQTTVALSWRNELVVLLFLRNLLVRLSRIVHHGLHSLMTGQLVRYR